MVAALRDPDFSAASKLLGVDNTDFFHPADSILTSNLFCIKEVAIRTIFSHMINIAVIIYHLTNEVRNEERNE